MFRLLAVRWRWWLPPAVAVVALALGVALLLHTGSYEQRSSTVDGEDQESDPTVPVDTVFPTRGGIERTTVQPGTLQAFESAALYTEISGYLKTQTVDIGSRVQKGEVVATVDVPDLEKQVEKNKAAVRQAEANVQLMKAQLERYQAEQETAKATIAQVEQAAEASKATRVYRQKAYLRVKQLFESQAVDERLLDEKIEQREAAVATERAAVASIAMARAQAASATARVKQAEAEITTAEAQVAVARAELERSQVQVGFATIRSPYTGVITRRNFFPGDFVRAATGSERVPLLLVERSDKMRMVVQVPDRDVPYADPGDPCDVEIDALPGVGFPSTSAHPVVISRVQGSEDLETRTMRVEIDLPNPTGRLRQGMYGRVKIHLEKPHMAVLSIPSRCLVGKVENGRGIVYVVKDGVAHRTEVRLGADDGVQVEVLAGLKPGDEVVRRSSGTLAEGARVIRSATPSHSPAAP